jgi:2-amino-4-hydroxy-6-hydroxymethyldihydropteridine diphosphokinase / dihydropteroate synthase
MMPHKMPLVRTHTSQMHKAWRAPMAHRAFIALGSNLGDRVAMIEKACNEMEASGVIHILRTSSLWETRAMYVLDQDNFVNGVCEVSLPIRR